MAEPLTAESLAAMLNGRLYLSEISKQEEIDATAAGLVVVFGASDDLMEFRGTIHDEIDCYDGGIAYLTRTGLFINECEEPDCPYFKRAKKAASTIEAVWAEDGYSWTYKTAIPHVTFEILDDGDKYCRGIVFDLKAVGASDA